MLNFKNKKSQSGFAALYLTILILTVSLTLTASIFVLTSVQQKDIQNIVQSSRSYYLAEAGLEDAIWRIKNSLPISSNYVMVIGTGQAAVSISSPNQNTKTIRAIGTRANVSKTLEVQLSIQTINPEFFYGAQAGTLGIVMENLSEIAGNVFSNGSIVADSGTEITDTVQVAGLGNKIDGVIVGGNAYADICNNSDIGGTLYASSQSGCSFGSFVATSSPLSPIALPISSQDIAGWKAEAEEGGVINGNQTFSGGSSALGPAKIVGNLTVQNDAQITLGGTLWVTGNVIVKNNAQVRLASSSGSLSGVVVADGSITIDNNSVSSGSGQSGSYLMYLSDSSLDPALNIKNNAQADILYTSAGWLQVENNASLREVTGYGLRLKNNARVVYEIGLQNALFPSGPGGSWQVESWQEVE